MAFGDPPLTWNDDLAKRAEEWALSQAIHSPYENEKQGPTASDGQDLFWQKYIGSKDLKEYVKCYNPLWYWYQ